MDNIYSITYNVIIEERTVQMKKKKFINVIATAVAVISALFAATGIFDLSGQDNLVEIPEGALSVHYIDVGQGDSILIGQNHHYMLIDAGENDQGEVVLKYLKSQGVDSLEYVVGTHPHSDHIGGLDDVIEKFIVDNIILPKVVHNTKTYKDVLTAVSKKGLKITPPISGKEFLLGDAKITILAPNSSEYDEINDYSVVLKVEYGNNSFLFTGDAEKTSENEMLQIYGSKLKCDVLKVGHHGSTTSSTEDFILAVNPKFAVIQVGLNNDYNHPHNEILDRLSDVKIFRTDIIGSIIAVSDGNNIDIITDIKSDSDEASVENNSEDELSSSEPIVIEDTIYIGNKNSKKFHKDSCDNLPNQSNRVYFDDRDEALKEGFEPCKTCNP